MTSCYLTYRDDWLNGIYQQYWIKNRTQRKKCGREDLTDEAGEAMWIVVLDDDGDDDTMEMC
jgi:hypothetical protein